MRTHFRSSPLARSSSLPPFKELAEGLIEDYYAAEFELGLDAMLDRY
jgi:hypothetical protein